MITEQWPIFCKDNLIIGNPQSSTGICTLWTNKDLLAKSVPRESFAVCGNLYTVQGINPMLKNILANPDIQNIILCGADLMKSGDALISFISNGIDNERKIIGSYGFIDSDISGELIEKLRKNIKIVDMRGKEKDLAKEIEKLPSAAPFMEPVFITTSKETSPSMGSDEISYRIEGKNIRETWLRLVDVIMKFGKTKPTQYGTDEKEILNVVAVVKSDLDWQNRDLENYYQTFFKKEIPFGVKYTYGSRMRDYLMQDGERFDQIENVIQKLKEVPHTRRAVVSIWDVNIDSDTKNTDPPCLTQVIFNVFCNKLYATAIFRSHDIFGVWQLNAAVLMKLQKEIAHRVGIASGSLTTVSIDAHIYENNWKGAKETLNKEYHGKIIPFDQDKNGYFVIAVKDNEIIVEHRVNDGRLSNYTFRGKKAQPLYRQILHENLIFKLDHAAYIGHELARAEIAMKEGKKFVQDEA
ncbi:MAG: DUF4346 domain-containing protein [Candidatus Aenigmarchaeota archaeon]|nr:DUF4346 domain-containing protein [Candidatus Aenigmarchaeota archaeon]